MELIFAMLVDNTGVFTFKDSRTILIPSSYLDEQIYNFASLIFSMDFKALIGFFKKTLSTIPNLLTNFFKFNSSSPSPYI